MFELERGTGNKLFSHHGLRYSTQSGKKWFPNIGLGLNLVSAIGIVMMNKMIYVQYEFLSMSLPLVHFLTTSLCLQLCVWLNVFSP